MDDNSLFSGFKRALVMKIIIGALPVILVLIAIFAAVLIVLDMLKNDSNSVVKNNCTESGFVINKTSLTKAQFMESLINYANANGMDQDFVVHAGDIYDTADRNNINPELVIVRAIAESGGNKQTGSYNYWGINCTNTGGGSDCESFDSFMAGVDRFIEIVSQYDSLNSMMAKYSYIGEYWYEDPIMKTNDDGTTYNASPGIGGCYYASYIYGNNIPEMVKTACEKKNCTDTNTSSCVKTTDDDQQAYTTWQVSNMASIRKSVFGLESSAGVICTGNNGNLSTLTNYNLKHDGLNVLNRTLSDSEIQELNNYLDSEIKKAGYGTGAGVAAAGQSLIYWLEQKGFYLQYYFNGGHGHTSGDSSFVYASPNWGSTAFGQDTGRSGRHHGPYFGMDCSGFVSWATRTACKDGFEHSSGSWTSKGSHISLSEAKPGDVLDGGSETHVQLVVKNNGDGSIIIAEESGGKGGLVFNNISSTSYSVISMEKWYSENCDRKGK